MERICRLCGRPYRGLVCHACHPRQKKVRSEEATGSPANAEYQSDNAASTVQTETTGPRG